VIGGIEPLDIVELAFLMDVDEHTIIGCPP
jgi:hypothetical protein